MSARWVDDDNNEMFNEKEEGVGWDDDDDEGGGWDLLLRMLLLMFFLPSIWLQQPKVSFLTINGCLSHHTCQLSLVISLA